MKPKLEATSMIPGRQVTDSRGLRKVTASRKCIPMGKSLHATPKSLLFFEKRNVWAIGSISTAIKGGRCESDEYWGNKSVILQTQLNRIIQMRQTQISILKNLNYRPGIQPTSVYTSLSSNNLVQPSTYPQLYLLGGSSVRTPMSTRSHHS